MDAMNGHTQLLNVSIHLSRTFPLNRPFEVPPLHPLRENSASHDDGNTTAPFLDGGVAEIPETSKAKGLYGPKLKKFLGPFRMLLGRRTNADWKTVLAILLQRRLSEARRFLDTREDMVRKTLNIEVSIQIALRNDAAGSSVQSYANTFLDALGELVSQINRLRDLLSEIGDDELFFETTRRQQDPKLSAVIDAEVKRYGKVKVVIKTAGWVVLAVSLGASIALAFVAIPAAVTVATTVATVATQARTHFSDKYRKKEEKLKRIDEGIQNFIKSEDEIYNCASCFRKFAEEDFKRLLCLVTNIRACLDSLFKNKLTVRADQVRLKDEISQFQQQQQQAIEELNKMMKRAKESGEKFAKTGDDLLRELGRGK